MSRLASSLQRSLHLLLVALALLCGTGVHEALHDLGASRSSEAPSAPFEVHDGGCPQRGDAPLHDDHSCVVCKSGGPQHAALPQYDPQPAPRFALCLLALTADARAFAAPVPGSIGARAPPVTVG